MIRVIIPTYNEELNLKETVLGVAAALKKQAKTFYLVNDGSTDGTEKIIRSLSRRYQVLPLKHSHNQGIARTFATGFRTALQEATDSDFIFLVEGDGTSDPSLLPLMLKQLKNGHEVVIASRYKRGGGYRNFPLKRMVLSLAANQLLKLTLPVKGVRDYTIFYRGYQAGPLKRMWAAEGGLVFKSKGFSANAELLYKLAPYVKGTAEVPFLYDYGRKRSPSSLKVLPNLRSYISLFRNY